MTVQYAALAIPLKVNLVTLSKGQILVFLFNNVSKHTFRCRKVVTCHSSLVEMRKMLQHDRKLHVISFTSLALIVQMPVAISPRAVILPHLRLRSIRLTSLLQEMMMISSESVLSTHPSMVLQGTVLFFRWIWAANHVRSLEITTFFFFFFLG